MFWSGKVKVIVCKTLGEISISVQRTTDTFGQITVAVLTEIFFFHHWHALRCQKHPLNSNLKIWCTKTWTMFEKNTFSYNFSKIVQVVGILVHQTFKFIMDIFWHPWDSWGSFNSGDSIVIWLALILFDCDTTLADFFFTFMSVLFWAHVYGHSQFVATCSLGRNKKKVIEGFTKEGLWTQQCGIILI